MNNNNNNWKVSLLEREKIELDSYTAALIHALQSKKFSSGMIDIEKSLPYFKDVLKQIISQVQEEERKKTLQEVEEKIERLPCGVCRKHGVNTYGECHCSYDGIAIVNKEELLSAIKQELD